MKNLTKKKLYIAILIILVISLAVEVLLAHPHGDEIWHNMPGADIVIGFVGAWILILFAKKLLAPLIQRDEDYYDKDGGKDNE